MRASLAYDIGIWGESMQAFCCKIPFWLVLWFVLKVVFSIGCVVGGFYSSVGLAFTIYLNMTLAYYVLLIQNIYMITSNGTARKDGYRLVESFCA